MFFQEFNMEAETILKKFETRIVLECAVRIISDHAEFIKVQVRTELF